MKQKQQINFAQRLFVKAARAFTLVELLAVVAILTVLVAVALPAYNNYSTKSKFAEVVLATGPTKTAIAACAETGDCVSGGAITLTVATSASSSGSSSTGQANMSVAPTWDEFMNSFITACYLPAVATQTQISSYYNMQNVGWSVVVDPNNPNNYCTYYAPLGHCYFPSCGKLTGTTTASMPASFFGSQFVYSPPVTAAIPGSAIPCVGSADGCSPATKYTLSVAFDSGGVVTGTAQSSSGLNGETFVLIPSYSSGRVDWSVSGTCQTRAGGTLC
jgi:type IV pilus assembly protein PilA